MQSSDKGVRYHDYDFSPPVNKEIVHDQEQSKVIPLPVSSRIHSKIDASDPGVSSDKRVDEFSEIPAHSGVEQAMADSPSREEVDAKLALVEARTETRFAEIFGEMRSSFTEIRGELKANNALLMEERAGRRVTNSLVIGAALTIVALFVAIFALGGAWFNNGLVVRDVAHEAAMEAVEQYKHNTETTTQPATPQTK